MATRGRLVMAAVAGIGAALAAAPAHAGDDAKKTEVRCWGVNSCGSQAKCSVTQADLDAMKALIGEAEYEKRFSKSTLHGCGSSAKCGASMQVLNWMKLPLEQCQAKAGYLIQDEGTGAAKKRVAKKA